MTEERQDQVLAVRAAYRLGGIKGLGTMTKGFGWTIKELLEVIWQLRKELDARSPFEPILQAEMDYLDVERQFDAS